MRMILLERQVSLKMLKLEAIVRRLNVDNPDYHYFKKQLGNAKAGYRGELWVDAAWLQIDIPTPYFLLHNYEVIDDKDYSYQMDTVFICPNFILVLEIKNITGQLDYDKETNQCIRTKLDGSKEGFSNAASQVRRHAIQLEKIIQQMDVSIPINFAVIMANPSTIIGSRMPYCPMFHVSGLPDYMEKLYDAYPQPVMNEKSLKRVGNKLKKLVRRKIPKIDFSKNDLLLGVICEDCKNQCDFNQGKWKCYRCQKVNNSAYQTALKDYSLLIAENISNNEFRYFLRIKDEHVAYRLLKKLNLESEGSYRNRKYLLPLPFK